MKVRLADIAERVGVSEATVSRVMNGKAGISDDTRRAVLTAVDELGYDRTRRLRPTRAGMVGLIVPELDNPIFPRFVDAIETELTRHGYTPLLCTTTAGLIQEDEYVQILLEQGVAGIVFVSGSHAIVDADPARYSRLIGQGIPIALINGYLPGVSAPCISNDDHAAADLAVSHLVTLGHERIGLATGQPRYVPVKRRIEGFRSAMSKYLGGALTPAELDALVSPTRYRVEGGAAAASALLDHGATAIVCGSDLMALGAIRAIRQRGLRVPQDVSIVGSDDSLLLEFTDPPLTTLRQPVAAMGETAVRALIEEMSGTFSSVPEYLFQPELVVRASTAASHKSSQGPR